jgi:hypothetical protein
MTRAWIVIVVAACGDGSSGHDTTADASPVVDAAIDAPPTSLLGDATAIDTACPKGAPAGATCKQLTITSCPGIETESIDAIIAIAPATGTTKGTVVHFSGSGGEGFQIGGFTAYQAAGFVNVFVSWHVDWETTLTAGIKAAGCRPSTALHWIFDNIHAADRTKAFCGEGFSAGSAQLGYALAHYGMGDYLDYVNELSGPPFARIDLGCDGDAPATATVCGATVTMRLPPSLDRWETIVAPNSCGMTNVPAAELARWNADSIAVGGVYDYPNTSVSFFDCTNGATTVTAMAQIYEQLVTGATYHCYSAADSCSGENLGTGSQDATNALLAGCVPRH